MLGMVRTWVAYRRLGIVSRPSMEDDKGLRQEKCPEDCLRTEVLIVRDASGDVENGEDDDGGENGAGERFLRRWKEGGRFMYPANHTLPHITNTHGST